MKNRLSEYIRRAREGETILVTDRGEIVAELSKHREEILDDIARLEADGLIARRGKKNTPELYPDLCAPAPHISVVDLLDDMRGDR